MYLCFYVIDVYLSWDICCSRRDHFDVSASGFQKDVSLAILCP